MTNSRRQALPSTTGFNGDVDQTILPTLLVLIPAISALGLYPLIARTDGADGRWVRVLGGALVGLVLVLVIVLVTADVPEWPPSRLDSLIFATIYVVLAGSSLASAGSCITTRDPGRTLWALLGLLVADAGLFLFLDARLVAAAALLLAAGTAVVSLRRPDWTGQTPPTEDKVLFCREPFLACTAGALLAVTLTGAVHQAWAVEAFHDPGNPRQSVLPEAKSPKSENSGQRIDGERSRSSRLDPQSSPQSQSASSRFDYQLLHNSLVVGALLLALGAVGWVGRRNRITMVLAAVIMLQGVMMTLCAFGQFHGSGTGEMVSLVVLAVAIIGVGLAFVLGKSTWTSR